MGSYTNKLCDAPKDKDSLELAYKQLGMTTMNVDNVIATILVDETAEADDVNGHDWADDMMGMINIMMIMKIRNKVNGRMKLKTLMMMMMKEI